MKNYKIIVIMKDLEYFMCEGSYNVLEQVFARITSELILRNRTENDILKLKINL